MSSIISKTVEGVLTLELNRPKVINALNRQLFEELHTIITKPPGDITALVLRGSGEKGFSAGADLKEMAEMDVGSLSTYLEKAQETIRALEHFPRPTIALLHGYVLGGGLELALGCDFLIAEDKTVFGMPETRVGLIPGFDGEKRLEQRIGITKTKEMIFTGRNYSASEALSIKLVDAVSQKSHLEEVLKLFLSSFAPNLSYAKKAFSEKNTIPLFIEAWKKK